MCLVFCGDYIIPYIGSVLLFYFGLSIKKFGFLGVRSLSLYVYLTFRTRFLYQDHRCNSVCTTIKNILTQKIPFACKFGNMYTVFLGMEKEGYVLPIHPAVHANQSFLVSYFLGYDLTVENHRQFPA